MSDTATTTAPTTADAPTSVILSESAAREIRNIVQQQELDAAKIVGTWEITKSPGDLPKGSMVTFDKDGKQK